MPPETCEKHDKTMGRLFDEINAIKLGQTAINTKMDEVISFKTEIHKLVHGNGHEGLVSKVRRLTAQIVTHWTIITIILVALVGMAVRLFWMKL